jgi:hypothetical protein
MDHDCISFSIGAQLARPCEKCKREGSELLMVLLPSLCQRETSFSLSAMLTSDNIQFRLKNRSWRAQNLVERLQLSIHTVGLYLRTFKRVSHNTAIELENGTRAFLTDSMLDVTTAPRRRTRSNCYRLQHLLCRFSYMARVRNMG